QRELHYSSFDDRPSRLFDGLEHVRLTIHLIGNPTSETHLHSTRYNKWSAAERQTLFDKLEYTRAFPVLVKGTFPKLTSGVEGGIIEKLAAQQDRLATYYSRPGQQQVFYSRKVGHFLQVLD